jgi:Rhs element Vgr protein
MPRIERTSYPAIKINGSDLPSDLLNDMMSAEVDLSINLPGMFVIDFFDPEVKHADNSLFRLGAAVSISTKVERAEDEQESGTLIAGEITALEAVFDAEGETRFRVRGYDKSHRLHRVQKTRVFYDVKDGDVLSRLISDAGLSAQVSSTTVVHKYIYQFRQTDYEFIRERARRLGFVCLLDGGKFKCGPPADIGSDGPELKYGDELLHFMPRLTTGGQVSEVKVRGWDYKNKAAVVASARSPGFNYRAGSSEAGGTAAHSAFGVNGSFVFHHLPIEQQSDAEKFARALLDEREASFLQGEGECMGDPRIKAGLRLNLTGLGSKFSGKYFVTRAIHRFTRVYGYRTEISVAGVGTNMLADLLGPTGATQSEPTRRLDGVVPAIVTNNRDEENLGRVKVKFPTIDDSLDSWWIPIAQPLAGPETGFWLMPKVNDEVLVAFEHGDFNRPYVVGSLWNGQDKPPADGANADPTDQMHLLQTQKKYQLKFDDKEEQIQIKTAAGHSLLLDEKNKKVEVVTSSGEQKILLDQQNKKVELTSTSMRITMDAQGPGKLEVAGPSGIRMTMDGGGSQLTLEGAAQVNVKSSGTVQVEGSGPVTIKGAIVNIN